MLGGFSVGASEFCSVYQMGASTLASLPRSGQTYGRSVDCEAGIWSFGAGWEADKMMLL